MSGYDTSIDVKCRSCGGEIRISFDQADYKAWEGGELIQNAMPYLPTNDREILISGLCGACYDNMFPDEEE